MNRIAFEDCARYDGNIYHSMSEALTTMSETTAFALKHRELEPEELAMPVPDPRWALIGESGRVYRYVKTEAEANAWLAECIAWEKRNKGE